MSVSKLHMFRQGAVVGSLARTAWVAFNQKKTSTVPPPPPFPGREYEETVWPRADALIQDYILHVGGDPSAYKGIVPFHLFPQWGFPILSQTFTEIPYDLTKVLNGGCAITINHQLPAGMPFKVRARLERVDANERRAIIVQRFVTETKDLPEALVVEQTSIVPFPAPKGEKKATQEKPRVPEEVREIGKFKAKTDAGWEFALLTGDSNPLHWVPLYAKAAGYKGCILHGFSTLARSLELFNRNVSAGDVRRLKGITVRFTRPLFLPGEARVFIGPENGIYAGQAPNGPAFFTGTYQV